MSKKADARVYLSDMDLALIRCALQTERTISPADADLITDLYDRIVDECAKRETEKAA